MSDTLTRNVNRAFLFGLLAMLGIFAGMGLVARLLPGREWTDHRTLSLSGSVTDDDDLFPAGEPEFAAMRFSGYEMTTSRNTEDPSQGWIRMHVPEATLSMADAPLARLSCRLARRAIQYPTQTQMRRFTIDYRPSDDASRVRTVEISLDACPAP